MAWLAVYVLRRTVVEGSAPGGQLSGHDGADAGAPEAKGADEASGGRISTKVADFFIAR